jgi:hypothetical protein
MTFSLLIGSMVACTSATAPAPVPQQATNMAPLAQYSLWWKMTEACSGLTGDFNSIKWYSHPDRPTPSDSLGDGAVEGEYYYDSKSVVIVESALNNPSVVRHEMLHALIAQRGHPTAEFRDKCGGIVTCVDACSRAVGTLPAALPDAKIVSVDSMQLTSSVAPTVISRTATNGWFALTVQVTNPRPYPVWVRLKPMSGESDLAATFGFSTAAGSRFDNVNGDLVSFAAGETKRVVFDLTIDDIPKQSGAAEISAFYNSAVLQRYQLDIQE